MSELTSDKKSEWNGYPALKNIGKSSPDEEILKWLEIAPPEEICGFIRQLIQNQPEVDSSLIVKYRNLLNKHFYGGEMDDMGKEYVDDLLEQMLKEARRPKDEESPTQPEVDEEFIERWKNNIAGYTYGHPKELHGFISLRHLIEQMLKEIPVRIKEKK